MKAEPGEDMAILGSGSIVSQLAQDGLIAEYMVVVNPVVLGKGPTMFDDVSSKGALKLTKTRFFGNGQIFLSYKPAACKWKSERSIRDSQHRYHRTQLSF